MPPKKPKLPDAAIADFATWVRWGAPIPVGETHRARSRRDEARRHWAFRPVRKVAPPKVEDAAWVQSPVDAFVLAKLEDAGWTAAPPAGRAEWIRRVTFDLTGLPPTPEEVEAFVADTSPDAYERLVDRLLAQPALRRAPGAALARRGPLRRDRGLRVRPAPARRLALPRLRDRLAQPRQAVRPLPRPSRSPATRSRRRTPSCLTAVGLPPPRAGPPQRRATPRSR